jgi:hypothetical protein
MTKMSETQRRAILGAHMVRTTQPGRMGMVIAPYRTLRVLQRNGWVTSEFDLPTRAGLVAAGIDMDKLHGQALAEWTVRDDDPRDDAVRAEAKAWRMRGGRGDGLLWAASIVREAAHSEALAVVLREGDIVQRVGEVGPQHPIGRVTYAPGSDAVKVSFSGLAPLWVGARGLVRAAQETIDAHSSAYWEHATAGMDRRPAW